MDLAPVPATRRLRQFLYALALFLVVVGARFYLLGRWSLALPYWDQWDGEGAVFLKPWLDGRLNFAALFVPHNEHRIFLTRVLSLALFRLNGQWDNLLEAGVNALGNGLAAALLAKVLLSSLGTRFRRRILLAMALYFVLPFGWENTLSGFQSQNYFLIWFSLAAVWGLGLRRPISAGWWLGVLGLALACLSMATGFLAAVAALGIGGLRLIRERRRPGAGEWGTALLCVAVTAAGWLTRTEVPAHAVLKAESFPLFVVALGRMLAWPLCQFPALGIVTLVPAALLLVVFLRRSPARRAIPGAAGLLGISLWAWLQYGALAYGRGGGNALPASRYMDLLAVAALVNFLIWQVLAAAARHTPWRGPILLGMILWLGLLGKGLWAETSKDFTGWLPWYAGKLHRSEQNMRGYIATGDFNRYLANKLPEDLPHPNPRLLASLVDDPALRAVLPEDLRPPLALQPEVASPVFVPGGYDPACGDPPGNAKTWGSFTNQGGATQGTFHARLESPTSLPYLRFSFSGNLGELDLRFALADASNNAFRDWHPSHPPGTHWHQDYLRKPGARFSLLAEDENASHWFAFSEPVEVGFWSYWMGFFIRRGGEIAAAGLLLWTCLELGTLLPGALAGFHRRYAGNQPPSPDSPRPLRLLSVVIPARDEAGGIAATVETLHAELNRHAVSHEILVVDDGSRDDTWRVLNTLTATVPALRPVQNPGPHGFGRAVVFGLDRMQGDAVVIMMADASDAPADVVRYWEVLSAGYDCAFGSRFVRGSEVHGYPWLKLAVNRLANLFIRELFRVPLNDTTNAFKGYRREVIEGCRPLISTQFNLTIELPLKAMVRGFGWQVVPISWRNRRTGAAKFRLKEMGSRYLFICLYLWLEKHLSRGDYRRQTTEAAS